MSFIHHIRENWHERSDSEKYTLMLVVGLTLVSLLYLLVVDPLIVSREQQKRNVAGNHQKYTQVMTLVERFQQQSSVSTSSEGLASVVDKSLRKNGLVMRGFQPESDNRARLQLTNVAYEPLAQWLHDLENTHHIIIEELSISRTKTAGLLMVNIRVRKKT